MKTQTHKLIRALVLGAGCLLWLARCDMPVPVNNTITWDDPVVEDSSFTMVSEDVWNATAVRKVLHVFAFGGFATDEQISTWADMDPGSAIVQMLTADTTNPLLSPPDSYDRLDRFDVTLSGLSALWSSAAPANKMPLDRHASFDIDSWNSAALTWVQAASKRGLNPVRHRLGLFETNYHLVANQDADVDNPQIFSYYDTITTDIAEHTPYQDLLATAALSSSIAVQYNHKENEFVDARFEGNEDFAREYHQLFFGILGGYDPEYHELTTIRNTAKALTDMTVEWVERRGASHWSPEVIFGTEFHFPGSLEILNKTIDGPTAREKIEALSQLAIAHDESLDNLPVILARGMADDHLDEEKIDQLRAMWAALEPKDVLAFLRTYAVSTTFHNESRIKFWSSINRNQTISNLMTLNNRESYLDYYAPQSHMRTEGVSIFRPVHNVFGHQTGLEASDEGSVFKEAYNRSVDRYWVFTRAREDSDRWQKDWAGAMAAADDGTYRVKAVAEWLWQRFAADGLSNFGALERAHVYALLGSGRDFSYFVDSGKAEVVYTAEEIETDTGLKELMGDMAIATMNLGAEDLDKRETANYRVGLAAAFITATPYVFAQEGL